MVQCGPGNPALASEAGDSCWEELPLPLKNGVWGGKHDPLLG